MLNCSESPRSGRAARCAVCDGKFGLVGTTRGEPPLFQKLRRSFQSSPASDRNWLPWFQTAGPGDGKPRGHYDVPHSHNRQECLKTADFASLPRLDRPGDCGSLKALADDYQRRAESLALTRLKHWPIGC